MPPAALPRGHAPAYSPRIRSRVQTGAVNADHGRPPIELVSPLKGPATRPEMGILPEPVPMMAVPPAAPTPASGKNRRWQLTAPNEPTPPKAKEAAAQRRNESVVRSSARHGAVVNGHVESVLSTMRDFFQTRPYSVLLDVFRNQDVSLDGAIQLEEFKGALRDLNLNLTDKDMEAVFKVCDKDQSGKLELNEFFNNFRKDTFPRTQFFWTSQRPVPLLKPEQRPDLLKKMDNVRRGTRAKRKDDDILNMLEAQARAPP
eukprot:5714068-Prymnesium_polylepis.1